MAEFGDDSLALHPDVVFLTLTGGEPLAHPHFFEIAAAMPDAAPGEQEEPYHCGIGGGETLVDPFGVHPIGRKQRREAALPGRCRRFATTVGGTSDRIVCAVGC